MPAKALPKIKPVTMPSGFMGTPKAHPHGNLGKYLHPQKTK